MSQTPPRVALVQSTWHADIVDRGRESFLATIGELGVVEAQIDCFRVPGAFEIPLHALRLARTGRYAAVVAAGLVVDGGIYRHEFVADAVVSGLMEVQLRTDVPVFSVVLTPHHFHEHATHAKFFGEHFATKGAEAARACVETLSSLARIDEIDDHAAGGAAPASLRAPESGAGSSSGGDRWADRR